ncbi:MAG: hypothetical protein II900_05755 [Prevotella sp.]|nr:hypothetical protein [Prevotella sp.]
MPSLYLRRAFAMPSLCLRYAFASGSLSSMEHQRTYNGLITEVERNCIGGDYQSIYRVFTSFFKHTE